MPTPTIYRAVPQDAFSTSHSVGTVGSANPLRTQVGPRPHRTTGGSSPPVATDRIRRRVAHGTGLGITVSDAVTAPQLQISDDARIDQAKDILRSAGADHLLIRTEDGHCGGLLTLTHLHRYRNDVWYTERIRVRDILHDTAPFVRPDTPADVALARMTARRQLVAPVVDTDGYAIGIVTAERLRAALAGGTAGSSQ